MRALVVGVLVGMVDDGELSISLLDLELGGGRRDT